VLREVRKAGTDVSVRRGTLFDCICNEICYHAKCSICQKGTVIYCSYLRFQVLSVVRFKKAVLLEATPCILVNGCRNLWGDYCLRL
jgi:hypothetical protein